MVRCCHVTLLVEAAGQVCSEQGSNVAGWYTLQPLYDQVAGSQPDLFDE